MNLLNHIPVDRHTSLASEKMQVIPFCSSLDRSLWIVSQSQQTFEQQELHSFEADENGLVACPFCKAKCDAKFKYQTHLKKCPQKPKNIYKCRANDGHQFRTMDEKKRHEFLCDDIRDSIIREEMERQDAKHAKIGLPVVVEKFDPDEVLDEVNTRKIIMMIRRTQP